MRTFQNQGMPNMSLRFILHAAMPALLVVLAAPDPSEAQQPPRDPHAAGAHGTHAGHDNTYADLVDREIRALSNEEVAALLAGEGMGFALAAELNGVPGPLHVLELRAELELTPETEEAISRLFNEMRGRTSELGAQVVELERTLDRRFAHRHIDAEVIRDLTGRIAALRGEIRAVHLEAHLDVDALLSDEQRARYLRLRGYTDGG